jgi:hypothetical protein
VKRKVHRAFIEERSNGDVIPGMPWIRACCANSHLIGFAYPEDLWPDSGGQAGIGAALSWLNSKCDAEHVL